MMLGPQGDELATLFSRQYEFKDKFICSISDEERIAVLDDYAKEFDLLTATDELGNTFIHFVIENSSLTLLKKILPKMPKKHLNCQNDLKETPLFKAVESGNYILAQLLKAYGADQRLKDIDGATVASVEKEQPKSPYPLRRMEEYEAVLALLNTHIQEPTRDFMQLYAQVQQLGFDLQEPLDCNRECFLNWLIINAPFHIVEKIIKQHPRFDVNRSVAYGHYLVKAILINKPKLARFFVSLGAKIKAKDATGKSAFELARSYDIDLLSKDRQEISVYDALMKIVAEATPQLARLNKKQKVQFLLARLINFAKAQLWQYEPSFTDYGGHSFLLDATINQPYTVNCFNMSECLREMALAIGIPVKFHVYKDITSKAFSQKPHSVEGDFACFDLEYQYKVLSKQDHYQFEQHCVLEVDGFYIDPTMNCSYANATDVVAPDQLKVISDSLSFNVYRKFDEQGESLPFSHDTLQQLNSRFTQLGWDVIQRRTSLSLISKDGSQKINIKVDEGCSAIECSNTHSPAIAALLCAWEACNPDLGFDYQLFSNEYTATNIVKELKLRRFNLDNLDIFDKDMDDALPLQDTSIKDKIMSKLATSTASVARKPAAANIGRALPTPGVRSAAVAASDEPSAKKPILLSKTPKVKRDLLSDDEVDTTKTEVTPVPKRLDKKALSKFKF